jgi:hypothetical protein
MGGKMDRAGGPKLPPPPPDTTRTTAGRAANGRFQLGVSGNPTKRFPPGTSDNPSGRPKRFSIHELVADAVDDNETRAEAVKRLQENLKRAKTVVSTLEFAARINREIGLGSDPAASRLSSKQTSGRAR